jgi:hypothetical protein
MTKSIIASVVVSLVVVAAAITAYHRIVIQPLQRVGVIDVVEIWKLKEKEFTDIVTRSAATDKDRQKAMEIATAFAKELPIALEQLPQECGCLVLLRTAIAASTQNTIDLTPALKRKLGLSS